MKQLYTRKEAAKRLGVSEDTLDRIRKAGQIAYLQRSPNGKVWISEDAIEEYFARITHPSRLKIAPQRTYRKQRI